MNYRASFGISFAVFFVSFMVIMFMSPELTAGLTKLSWDVDELDPVRFEKAKEIFQRCDLSEDEFNRINQVLFDIDKEFYLNNDTVKSERMFKSVLGDIIECNLKTEGIPLFLDTALGKLTQIIAIVSGVMTTAMTILGFKKHGRNFL